MRERRLDTVGLRVWGRQLDDAQFGRAISALGALLAASKARDATVFQHWAAGIDFQAELTRLIAPRPDGRRRIAWTISPLVDAKGKVDEIQQLGLDPLRLADAWAAALAQLPGWDPRGAPSFEVRAANFDLASHAQLSEWLGPRPAPTASYVVDPDLGAGNPFEWPVSVAVVPGTGSEGFVDRLRAYAQTQHPWVLDLVKFVTPEFPREGCSILLAPWSLQGAVEWLAIGPQRFDAACLIALDWLEFASNLSVGSVRRELNESAAPSVVGVVEVPEGDRDRWFVDLIRELSHDHTIDHALRLATIGGPVPLVIAEPSQMSRFSVREIAVRAVNSLERFDGDLVELPPLPAGSFPMPPGRYPRSEVLRLFQDPQAFGSESSGATAVSILSQVEWDFEGGGAGVTEPEPPGGYETGGPGGDEPVMAAPDEVEIDGRGAGEPEEAPPGDRGPVADRGPAGNGGPAGDRGPARNGGHAANGGPKPAMEPPDLAEAEPPPVKAEPPGLAKPTPPPTRYLQAQVRQDRHGVPKLVRGPVEPLTTYLLDVHVGPPRRNWVRGETPLPPDAIPQDDKPHDLQVIFDPGGRAKPIVSKVVLPAAGPSTTCRFEFKTPARGRFRGRVILQFRNRVLQTALVTADLTTAAAQPGTTAGLRVQIEATLRPGMVALDQRLQYDLAIVHNDDDAGKPRATASAGTWAAPLRPADIKDQVKVIQGLLSKAGRSPEDYKTLRSIATVDLIFALANHGVDMRNGLFEEPPPVPTKGDEVQRVQILAANPNAFLPIEFLYDFPPPTQDATMCPNAEQALLDGHCDPKKFHQPEAADGAIPVVCPVGFWAMNRVIERHATTSAPPKGKAGDSLRSFPIPGRDTLGGLSTALFAHSDRVLGPDADTVMEALTKAAPAGATRAKTWMEWVEDVKARGPDVLVLLAHTAKNARANQTALEIAASDQVPAGRFSERYVRLAELATGKPDDRPGPLVFLLGCETVLPWLEYQTFVVRFQEREASIVVGTVATVAASHAAKVAVRLVQEFAARSAKRAGRQRAEVFGDVLLTARRKLLSEGEVMALCLTSYGDADWKLA